MGLAHCYPVGPAWASHVGGLWLHGQELGGPSTPGLAFKATLCWAFSSSCPGRPPFPPPHTHWGCGDAHMELIPWGSTGVLDMPLVAKRS